MSQEYDKIIRENFKELLPAIIRKVIQLDAKDIQVLPTDMPVTLERRPDFVVRAKLEDEIDPALLHIEFQSSDDPLMHLRMLEYRGFLSRKYQTPVRQYVLYMGTERSGMVTGINQYQLNFSFSLIHLTDYGYEGFVRSSTPEEVILAILADFGLSPANDVIQAILRRLGELYHLGLRIEKQLPQLEVLAKLRNLQSLTAQTISNMPITYNLQEDIRYQQGEMATLKIAQMLVSEDFKNGTITVDDIAAALNIPAEKVQFVHKAIIAGPVSLTNENPLPANYSTQDNMRYQQVRTITLRIASLLTSDEFKNGYLTMEDIAVKLNISVEEVALVYKDIYQNR